MARGELRISGDHAKGLLSREGLLPKHIPARIKLTLLLVGPFRRHMVGRVGGTGGHVEEKGLSGWSAFCWRIQPTARVVMSSVKW